MQSGRTSAFRLSLVGLAILWLALRIVFWNGYYTEDAPGYVTDAIYAALGQYHARNHVNGLNVGTYLPVAVPIWLLGKSEIALSVWPMLCSLLGAASMVTLVTRLVGPGSGVLAGLLYVTYPGDIFFSTVVMPDAIQAGWMTAAMAFIAAAFAEPSHPRPWRLFAGGLALGVTHLVRANDVTLIPVGIVSACGLSAMLATPRASAVVRHGLLVVAGWGTVLAVEGLAYLWASGDFLLRLHVVSRHYGSSGSIAQWGLNVDPRTIPYSLLAPIEWWLHGNWGEFNQDQALHGLVFAAAVVAMAIAAVLLIARRAAFSSRAGAAFAVAAIWLLWPILYHQFGSQSLTAYVPVHRLSRHLVVYAPGAIFATVVGCSMVHQRLRSTFAPGLRALAMAAALVVLAAHLTWNWQAERLVSGAYHQIKDTYARIRDRLPGDVRTVVGDPGDLCFLDFWMNPLGSEPIKMVAFANYATCDGLTDAVVLTRANAGWNGVRAPIIEETVARLPCLDAPPPTWRLVYDGFPERIYQIGR